MVPGDATVTYIFLFRKLSVSDGSSSRCVMKVHNQFVILGVKTSLQDTIFSPYPLVFPVVGCTRL